MRERERTEKHSNRNFNAVVLAVVMIFYVFLWSIRIFIAHRLKLFIYRSLFAIQHITLLSHTSQHKYYIIKLVDKPKQKRYAVRFFSNHISPLLVMADTERINEITFFVQLK